MFKNEHPDYPLGVLTRQIEIMREYNIPPVITSDKLPLKFVRLLPVYNSIVNEIVALRSK